MDHTVIMSGCILADGVTVGPNVTLEAFSRVSTLPFEQDEDDESESEVERVLEPRSMSLHLLLHVHHS